MLYIYKYVTFNSNFSGKDYYFFKKNKEATSVNSYTFSIRRSCAAETFDYESLCKNYEQLSYFEKQANSRVIESGLLKGINLEDIRRTGERLVLQDGCKEFFHKAINMKGKLNAGFHILSYCWCADLIRSVFGSGKSCCCLALVIFTIQFKSFLVDLAVLDLILLVMK